MSLFIAVPSIGLVSVLFAFISLKTMHKGLKTKETKKVLEKGRVLFYSSKSSSKS